MPQRSSSSPRPKGRQRKAPPPVFRSSARGVFEVDNARTQTLDQVVSTFIPTTTFWRCLSSKHHIVVGPRGSGKTAIARILAHNHLSQLKEVRVRTYVAEQKFIGTYVPMRLEWASGLQSKTSESLRAKENIFQWRLNVAVVRAFITTARSCLDRYIIDDVERARLEISITKSLSRAWLYNETLLESPTLESLDLAIKEEEYRGQIQVAYNRNALADNILEGVTPNLCIDLFSPLEYGIKVLSRFLEISEDASWLLCLDEAEFLDIDHHRILNSYLRSYTSRIFFKITTMPYKHHTLETNTEAPLNEGEDFEYLHLDKDPVFNVDYAEGISSGSNASLRFADSLFQKRLAAFDSSYSGLSLNSVFGTAPLLHPGRRDKMSQAEFMALVRKHCNSRTVNRAERMIVNAKTAESPEATQRIQTEFENSIERKLRGALVLRDEVASKSGRTLLRAYRGAEMIVRCSDGNPRRLLRCFNHLLQYMKGNRYELSTVSPTVQNSVLTEIGRLAVEKAKTERDVGFELYNLISLIGDYFRGLLHDQPLSTDLYGSIEIQAREFASYGEIVQRGVGRGLLYPDWSLAESGDLTRTSRKFRLAYVVAPYFCLMPRRGRSKSLSAVLTHAYGRSSGSGKRKGKMGVPETLPLFDGGACDDEN